VRSKEEGVRGEGAHCTPYEIVDIAGRVWNISATAARLHRKRDAMTDMRQPLAFSLNTWTATNSHIDRRGIYE